MKIIIETLLKKQIPLDIEPNDKIIDIKTKIQEKEGIHPDSQRLTFKGEQLEDDVVVKDYSIQDNSTILLVIQCAMKIFIETSSGKTIKLGTKPLQKISSIKEIIQDKEGILPKYQKLFYNGNELEDEKSLLDYSIESNSTLKLQSEKNEE